MYVVVRGHPAAVRRRTLGRDDPARPEARRVLHLRRLRARHARSVSRRRILALLTYTTIQVVGVRLHRLPPERDRRRPRRSGDPLVRVLARVDRRRRAARLPPHRPELARCSASCSSAEVGIVLVLVVAVIVDGRRRGPVARAVRARARSSPASPGVGLMFAIAGVHRVRGDGDLPRRGEGPGPHHPARDLHRRDRHRRASTRSPRGRS